MSRQIWLIRHGESIANAGAATINHRTIPLTEKGKEQAKNVSLLFEQSPEIIIVSPFTRAKETAEPTRQRFLQAKTEVWDVQEFTYLAPKTCVNTTADQRRDRVNAYWERLDPDYIDGEGAESFREFIERVQKVLQDLDKISQGLVVIFSHAQFIRAMCCLKEGHECNVMKIMKLFRSLPKIDNCEIKEWKE